MIGSYLSGTQYLVILYRILGAKIASDVILRNITCFTDPHLTTIVNHVQCHTFEQRLFKLVPVTINDSSVITSNALILSGAQLQRQNRLLPWTFVMKDDQVSAKTNWSGVPARLFCHSRLCFFRLIDETCGTDLGFCHDDSTLPPAAIAIIIMASICCFITCLSCCIHSHQRQQRLQANFANANTRMNTNPYQQQVIHGPVRVVHVRPVSYVGAVPTSRSFPSIYEAPPPSYEIATASLPSIHGSSSSYPPMIATVEQSHSSIV
ncbi:unnamed protein product [Adineta steineri]|uniref:Uncharacterized protein n=1 Tax=Adineta steineri TaxID=433720 RepID=A0A819GYD8_9BILA|nr:unnamed protein product [Adineta steineri]